MNETGGIKFQWEIVSRFQSTCSDSNFSSHAEPRQTLASLDTWNAPGLQENVFCNLFSTFDSPRDHPQGIHPCAPQRERGSVPQQTGTGTIPKRSFTRDDKQNGDTILMPTFAGRPSTMSSLILVDFPQNSMVGQQRQEISELKFDKIP